MQYSDTLRLLKSIVMKTENRQRKFSSAGGGETSTHTVKQYCILNSISGLFKLLKLQCRQTQSNISTRSEALPFPPYKKSQRSSRSAPASL